MSGRGLIADGLSGLLSEQPGVASCAVAWDGPSSRAALLAHPPTTIVADLDELGCGPALAAQLFGSIPGVRRIGCYDTFTARHADMAFELSLTALLPLTSPLDHIVDVVLSNQRPSSVTVIEGLSRDELARISSLTRREVEVLQHLAAGRQVKAIARLMGITPHTVETHKRRAFGKLGARHEAQAVALAVSGGVVVPT